MAGIESKIMEIEVEESLFDMEIDDIKPWERIRFKVFRDIDNKARGSEAHTKKIPLKDVILKAIQSTARSIGPNNPFLSDSHEVLFIGHQRRKKHEREWVDIYCDPIHESCVIDSVHYEQPYLYGHKTPSRTKSVRYLDLALYMGTVKKIFGNYSLSVPDAKIERLTEINNRFCKTLGVNIDFTKLVLNYLRNRKCRLPVYKKILERVDPSLVVLVVSYGFEKETFIEACMKKGIPVAELQHGAIHDKHLGYSFPNKRHKKTFPDYFLSWGKYWSSTADFPILDQNIIPVGFPYLQQKKKTYRDVHSQNQVLFISQGKIGQKLSKFAASFSNKGTTKIDIVYKLHPGEYVRWREEYPWLLNNNIEVLAKDGRELYRLFAESSVQVGVSSTALFEGLCFDLETYLLDCAEAEPLNPLVTRNIAKVVSSVEQLDTLLGSESSNADTDDFFAPNATGKMCHALRRLQDRHRESA